MNNQGEWALQTRAVLDLNDYGNKLIFAVKEKIPYRVNHWTSKKEYMDTIWFIYRNLLDQCVANMDKSEYEFAFNLLSLPDYSFGSRIHQLLMDVNKNYIGNVFRELAMYLFFEIKHRLNPNGINCQYTLDGVTETYIVLSVHVRIR